LPAIASGPTVVPKASRTAEEIAERYALDITFPDAGTSSFGRPAATRVIANLPAALDAAAREAERLGMRPVVLSDRFEGEARELGRTLAAIFKGRGHPLSPLQAGACVLAGGETTVIVRGDGVGGRNSEAALAAAIELRESSGVTVGFLATDGDDGVTGAAGAIVDGATISTEAAGRARRALERNDSFGFLAETGAVWAPGATGTNVNDLVIAIIE
jgi:glycerate-2-kinase